MTVTELRIEDDSNRALCAQSGVDLSAETMPRITDDDEIEADDHPKSFDMPS